MTPDQELVDFAESFSRQFKELPIGLYSSSFKKYDVSYIHFDNDVTTTPCRIDNTNAQREFNIHILKKEYVTPEFVYFIVIWIHLYQHGTDPLDMDKQVVNFCRGQGKDIAAIYRSFLANVQEFDTPASKDLNRLSQPIWKQ